MTTPPPECSETLICRPCCFTPDPRTTPHRCEGSCGCTGEHVEKASASGMYRTRRVVDVIPTL